MKRATIADLAQASGVSIATVNRVLKGGDAVREGTVLRVRDAAARIGFHATGLIERSVRARVADCRIGILLERADIPFYREFAGRLQAAIAAAQGFRGTAVFEYWETEKGDAIASRLQALSRRVDAVAVVSPDHPAVSDAIDDLRRRSIPVFALLSDCAPGSRTGYIGIDNRKAGRTAGWMLAQCARGPGKLVVFVGSHRFSGHEMRELGLRSFIREHAPHLSVLETQVNHESVELTTERLGDLLIRHDDIVGCYMTGGGTMGAAAALRALPAASRPTLISSDSAIALRGALADRILAMTISEPLDRIGATLARSVAAAISGEGVPGQQFEPFEIFTPENI